MARPARHRPDYRMTGFAAERFACAALDLAEGRQTGLAFSADENTLLVVYGLIYEDWLTDALPAAEQLLGRWESLGWRGLAGLNGEYIVLVWEEKDRRLTVVNDRLGLKRLHYWQGKGGLALASELKSLAALGEVSREVDEEALAELLIFGHLQDDRTLLKDVRLVPPASVLEWSAGRMSLRTYWDYEYKADVRLYDPLNAAEEYGFNVRRAVERRIRGRENVGLFLSGGLDARTLAGMFAKLRPGRELQTWTTGHGHDHDTRFAREIARAIGSRHASVTLPENFLNLYASEYAWALDGMVSAHGAHRRAIAGLGGREADLVLIGYMGDTVSGGKPLDKVYHIKSRKELLETGFSLYEAGLRDEDLARLLKPAVYKRVRGRAN
jgi:asparagine synthase (glutamine-hydrolysing)